MNVKLVQIKLGDGEGADLRNPYLIYATKADGAEELIYSFTGDQYNTEIVYDLPKPLEVIRMRFFYNSGLRPTYIKLFGEYSKVKAAVFPLVPKYPFGNQTGVNGFSWSWPLAGSI
jgi:hypothetical protein